LVADILTERLGIPFAIENCASGIIAGEALARSAPDGYTLLLARAIDFLCPVLHDDFKFSFVRDLLPVASIYREPSLVVVRPTFPGGTFAEVLDEARRNPGKLRVASAGVGSTSHVCWELLRSMTRVDMLHVPYDGAGPALADLLAGQVDVMFG